MTRVISAVIAALTLAGASVAMAQEIRVQVDGNEVYFANTQPRYVDGRVLVPLRGVFEQMGARVNWNPDTRTVSAIRGDTRVRLHVGSHTASVNGTPTNLDVPAMIVGGSTMVPIRFVSEALGAQVGWFEANQLVTISSDMTQTQAIVTPPRHLRRAVMTANEVIPVELDQELSSASARRGQFFSATVRTNGLDSYADIPRGAKLEGHVAAVHQRAEGRPAILDLAFDDIRFPSGKTVPIDACLTSLGNRYVAHDANGHLVARTTNASGDDRMVYAGYGAGAGLLVGVLSHRPLEGAVLGGALGYIVSQVQPSQHMTSNVILYSGTEMGVRIRNDVVASW